MTNNDYTKSSDVDEALAALAREDRLDEAPQHVEVSVMAAWDARRAVPGARHALSPWAVAAAIALVTAGTLFAIRSPSRGAGRPTAGHPSIVQTNKTAERLVAEPPDVPAASLARVERAPAPGPRTHARAVGAGPVTAVLDLIDDPLTDPASLQVVRVRMARSSMALLGIPIADPEAQGTVELEVLVGEDGVARGVRAVSK